MIAALRSAAGCIWHVSPMPPRVLHPVIERMRTARTSLEIPHVAVVEKSR